MLSFQCINKMPIQVVTAHVEISECGKQSSNCAIHYIIIELGTLYVKWNQHNKNTEVKCWKGADVIGNIDSCEMQ